MKTRSSKTKSFIWMFVPITHSIIYHYQKVNKSFLQRKDVEGTAEASSQVFYRFHSDRILFRFFSDRVLLRVLLKGLSDRVLFKSSVIGSSSESSIIDSSLGSSVLFLELAIIFYQNVLPFFFTKNRCSVLHYVFKKNFTLNNK